MCGGGGMLTAAPTRPGLTLLTELLLKTLNEPCTDKRYSISLVRYGPQITDQQPKLAGRTSER